MIEGMRTGELARQAGVSIQTIHYYERERLLVPPPRTATGYRCYSSQDLDRVVFIKTCQQLASHARGCPLTRWSARPPDFKAGSRAGEAERVKLAAIARHRIHQIDEKLSQLSEMRRTSNRSAMRLHRVPNRAAPLDA